jgi:hypothetical protein
MVSVINSVVKCPVVIGFVRVLIQYVSQVNRCVVFVHSTASKVEAKVKLG